MTATRDIYSGTEQERIVLDPNDPNRDENGNWIQPKAWVVKRYGSQGDLLIECPYCENGAIVAGKEWMEGAGAQKNASVRAWTYCEMDPEATQPKGWA